MSDPVVEELLEKGARAVSPHAWDDDNGWTPDTYADVQDNARAIAGLVADAMFPGWQDGISREVHVTGEPGEGFPSYDFTFGSPTRVAMGWDQDPLAAAAEFVAPITGDWAWAEGPDRMTRLVIRSAWVPVEEGRETASGPVNPSGEAVAAAVRAEAVAGTQRQIESAVSDERRRAVAQVRHDMALLADLVEDYTLEGARIRLRSYATQLEHSLAAGSVPVATAQADL